MGRVELLERARNIVFPVVDNLGYDLVEISFVASHGRRVLRVFIDRREGITLNDCARTSKAISAELDRHDLFTARYYLEVSSPGAERRLRTREDFEHFAGRKARVRFRVSAGGTRELTGRMLGFKENVLVFEPEGGAELSVPFGDILSANLSI
ncbi:MAG TPA: ribosome maturation factor RimP [bacterium]|nr:ribosome maturation factor RimP [bacterium]